MEPKVCPVCGNRYDNPGPYVVCIGATPENPAGTHPTVEMIPLDADQTLDRMDKQTRPFFRPDGPLGSIMDTHERTHVGTPDDGYAAARYLWQTPYKTMTEWMRAILDAIPEGERCPICKGHGRTVIYASNGGPSEFPVCWSCLGSRRKVNAR